MTNPSFIELNLSEPLLRAIQELGYTSPTPIQMETLPKLLGGDTDFLGLAATGTGKTAAFSIPLLERLDPAAREVQALVLCPTRELAIQVAGQIDLLGKHLKVRALPIYGGTGYGDQLHGLRSGAQIVVGTPGRVVDHIEKGTLRLENLRTLVLDEADEMISMGFQEDLEAVLKAATTGRDSEGADRPSIWLFSATMGRDVKHVADSYLRDPQRVQINRTEMLPNTVEQIFYKIHEYDKPDLLTRVIDVADDFYGIVFCQTKALVTDVYSFLLSKGYKVDALHGDLDQKSRDRVMQAFRDRKISVLVATDVACRGLDVKDVTHVVNYSLPRELDNYVHRIGRTARSGKTGTAISFVTFSHRELVGKIERMTKSRLDERPIPSRGEIASKRVAKVRATFEAKDANASVSFVDESWNAALDSMSKQEIAARFLSMLLPDAFVKDEKVYGKQLTGKDSRLQRDGSLSAKAHAVRPERSGHDRPERDGARLQRGGGFKKGFRQNRESDARFPRDDRGERSRWQDHKERPWSEQKMKPWGKQGSKKPWSASGAARFQKESDQGHSPGGHGAGGRWKNNFKRLPSNQPEAFQQETGSFPKSEGSFGKPENAESSAYPLKKKPKKLYGKWKERAEQSFKSKPQA